MRNTTEISRITAPRELAPIRLEERPDGQAILRLLRDIHPEIAAPARCKRALQMSLPGAMLSVEAFV